MDSHAIKNTITEIKDEVNKWMQVTSKNQWAHMLNQLWKFKIKLNEFIASNESNLEGLVLIIADIKNLYISIGNKELQTSLANGMTKLESCFTSEEKHEIKLQHGNNFFNFDNQQSIHVSHVHVR